MKPKNDKRFVEKIRSKVSEAIIKYDQINPGDNILVGLSGGKDSMALLDVLVNRKRILPFDFKLTAVHIDITTIPYETDRTYLQAFCDEREVAFIYVENDVVVEAKKANKSPCFYCSWNRRKSLFAYALQNNYSKLALGHHLDDAVETLLMNMTYHGEMSSLPGKLSMFDGKLHLIRPLLLLTDAELRRYSTIIGYRPLVRNCPFENITMRNDAGEIIRQLSKINPKAKFNLFRAMENINQDYLPSSTK